jgi:hypothetical protein
MKTVQEAEDYLKQNEIELELGFFNGVNLVNLLLDFANQSKWIDVNDELPPIDDEDNPYSQNVLGLGIFGTVYGECFYSFDKKKWFDFSNDTEIVIIKWQPIPTI